VAVGGAIGGDELGDNGEFLGGIDLEARAIEGLVAHTVGVEIATVGIANGGIAVGSTAGSTLTARKTGRRAWVGSVGGGNLVGLPDIHLITAGTVVASARVGIVGRATPTSRVGL
ncbi:hypothetical protein H0H87_004686, partial [Tephrocybe sp. NHM501043]